MERPVDIAFECLPLRSLGRLDIPIDASPTLRAMAERVQRAVRTHGHHNTYYLHAAKCVFHLTSDPAVGMIEFGFEGTVLTDEHDREAVRCDLDVSLRGETCDWLTEPAVAWFRETVRHAVIVEFNRFVAAGDLNRTIERLARLQAESDAQAGFLGIGL